MTTRQARSPENLACVHVRRHAPRQNRRGPGRVGLHTDRLPHTPPDVAPLAPMHIRRTLQERQGCCSVSACGISPVTGFRVLGGRRTEKYCRIFYYCVVQSDMAHPSVTVVIPAYVVARPIERAPTSVWRQKSSARFFLVGPVA